MADPTTMRINSDDRPDREQKLTAVVEKYELNQSGVLRKLIDAFLDYVDANGRPPHFPIAIVPKDELTPARK